MTCVYHIEICKIYCDNYCEFSWMAPRSLASFGHYFDAIYLTSKPKRSVGNIIINTRSIGQINKNVLGRGHSELMQKKKKSKINTIKCLFK